MLLLLPLIPLYIMAMFIGQTYVLLNPTPSMLYMLGLTVTFVPLILMPSKIHSGSKLKALRMILLVLCALFIAGSVFASTTNMVSGDFRATTTTHPHTFSTTVYTVTIATTYPQCSWTTIWEYYGSGSQYCFTTITGATSYYSTWFSTTTGSSVITSYITGTTWTWMNSVVYSPIILEPKSTYSTYEYYWTTYTTSAYTTSSYWKTTGGWTSTTYSTTLSSIYTSSPMLTTSWDRQVDVVTQYVAQTTVTVATGTVTNAYGYLARDASTGAIYYIYNSQKYHVLSMAALGLYHFRDGQWATATAAELAYASGYDLNGYVPLPPLLLANGALMGDTTTFAIYYVAGGTKYHITSMAAFTGYGFNVADIVWVPSAHTTLYADGADLSGGALPWPV
jgi:hypothetical protein